MEKRNPIPVYHKQLSRGHPDSLYRSKCPCCSDGLLLVYREEKYPYRLLELDNCILCGQRFEYLDIEEMRAAEGNS